jgi:DNA-binding CsgD family transcriptional regulator
MQHVYIFALIFNLICGTLSYAQVRTKSKFPGQSFLIPLKKYLIGLNLLIVVYFSLQYVKVTAGGDAPAAWLMMPVHFLFITSETAILFYLFKFLSPQGHSFLSPAIHRVLAGITLALLLVQIPIYTLSSSLNRGAFFGLFNLIWEFYITLTLVSVLGMAIWTPGTAPWVRRFARIHLPGYVAYLLPHVTYYLFGLAIGMAADPITLLYLNITPLFWLKGLNTQQTTPLSPLNVSEDVLRERYGISQREFEIITLVMAGRSNREIAEDLYLSFHTAKNHLYNIFRKLNVKSRSQLIGRVQTLQGSESVQD